MPDDLFRRAELAARRLKVSRSELFANALSAYLEKTEAESITERLNQVYSEESSSLDPVLQKMQFETLKDTTW
jgi:metal-responsive CopG/Arc/MetJ family transcriptional regulator